MSPRHAQKKRPCRAVIPRRRPARPHKTGQRALCRRTARLKSGHSVIESALALAEGLVNRGQHARIVDAIGQLERLYPFESAEHRSCYNRLMALGFLYQNDLLKAEQLADRAVRDDAPSMDIAFVQAYVKTSLREFRAAIGEAEKYLDMLAAQAADPSTRCGYCTSSSHASQVSNFLGVARAALHQTDGAIAAWRRAIELYPAYDLPYLNLANFFIGLGRREEAVDVVNDGLRRCRLVHELRMIQETVKHRPTVSACMIVRNEEELLPGCLDSIRDWVDEIILVDTGSTDRTVAIAEEYRCRVFHLAWEDDFSKARNYALQQATGEWILVIDADERVFADDVPLIRSTLRSVPASMISVDIYNVYERHESRVTYASSIRLFKRELNLRYAGIVHNDLVLAEGVPVLPSRIRIKHLGYDLSPEKMRCKFERTRALLQRQLAADPDDVFALFNYAELLRGVEPSVSPENASEIIRAAGRVAALVEPADSARRHLLVMCLGQLACAHLALEQHEEALDCGRRALEQKPDYPDAFIYLGFACLGLERYEEAIWWFESYLENQANFDAAREAAPIILIHPDSRDLACGNLGILFELTGDWSTARTYYLRALQINPGFRQAATALGRLCLTRSQLGRDDPAIETLVSYLEVQPDDAGVALLIADHCRGTGDYVRALQYYEKALTVTPTSVDALFGLSECHLNTGHKDSALMGYRRVLDLQPDFEPAAQRLALLSEPVVQS